MNMATANALIEQDLAKAIALWSGYFAEKVQPIQSYPDVMYPAFHMTMQGPCDGSEDLKLYFGGANDEIDAVKALVARSCSGTPYMSPEVVLLLKAKNPRPKDELDFAAVHADSPRDSAPG